MKKQNSDERLTYLRKKNKKTGKIFILFVFACFFTSLIFISSALANLLCIKNWGLFVKSASVPAVTIYCVASGQFETENSAIIQSELIKEKGGAGYIYKNGETFTVLLFAYLNQATAQKVIENNSDKVADLFCLTIETSQTKIQHNKSAKDISSLTNICQLPLNTFKKLQAISNSFDGGELTSSQTFNKLFSLSYEIENVIKNFESQSLLVSSENYNMLLEKAKNIFSKVNNVILNSSKQSLSCNIKHVALEVLFVGESLTI